MDTINWQRIMDTVWIGHDIFSDVKDGSMDGRADMHEGQDWMHTCFFLAFGLELCDLKHLCNLRIDTLRLVMIYI